MSNTNTNSVEFEAAPYADVPETLPETEEATQTKAPAPKKKRGGYRFFSFLLIAVSAVALFLPVQVLKEVLGVFQPEKTTLFACITDLFGGGETSTLFGMLPVYTDAATVTGMLAGAVFYALLVAIAFTVLFGLLALLSGNAGLFRIAAFFFATGFGTYAICGYALPTIQSTAGELGIDVIIVAIASAGALLYLILSFAKKGTKAFVSLAQLLFTLVFVKMTVMILKDFSAEITTAVEGFGLTFDLTLQILAAVIWVVALLGAIRLLAKKGLALDMFRYIVQLVVGAVLCYVAFTAKAADNMLLNYAFVAAVVSLAQIVICVCQCKSGKPKKAVEKEAEEEDDIPVAQPVPDPVPEYTVEEYAEALPYEGGPVEGVEVAQEVNPTFIENPIEPVQVNTAGYDFYNSKSFDPFIAILNAEERNQFTEIFILKYKGMMPEIPDYQVGGTNKEFFRKLFIYLGQYREIIPDGLLSKIYQFAIRNS